MFNLVQIQERLKDMPMQALMAYANGQSQEVPPFLALGELNRRKRMQSSAQAEQAKAMEGAPTVKEQIEQSTGLMALQGARQRQAASQQQGLQALAPNAPAPNTTTSEPAQLASGGAINDVIGRDYQRGGPVGQMNPQMLKKLMMLKKMKQMQQARSGLGGLAGKDYAGGGIVAFQSGGITRTQLEDYIRRKETGGEKDPNTAVSRKGAVGMMQVMPETAMDPGHGVPSIFDLAERAGVPYEGRDRASAAKLLQNPKLNQEFSTNYMGAMLQKYANNPKLAAAAYNAGPGAVDRAGGVPNFRETQEYVKGLPERLASEDQNAERWKKTMSALEDRSRTPGKQEIDNSMYDELQGLGSLRGDRGLPETGAERLARKQEAARGKMGRWYRGEPEPTDAQVTEAERAQRRYTLPKDQLSTQTPPIFAKAPPAEPVAARAVNPDDIQAPDQYLDPEAHLATARPSPEVIDKNDPRYKAGIANQNLFQDTIYGRAPVMANDRAAALAKTAPTGQDQNIVRTGGQPNQLDALFKQYQDRIDAIEKARAGQKRSGMDDLMEYLGAIATSKRGGNWATQGAEAAQAVSRAQEARRNARNKEDLEMAKLYGDLAKDRYQMETQRMQATKPGQQEYIGQLLMSGDPAKIEVGKQLLGIAKSGELTLNQAIKNILGTTKGQMLPEDEVIKRAQRMVELSKQPLSASASIPPGAIDALRKNPSLAGQFDAKYGQGAAAKILGK